MTILLGAVLLLADPTAAVQQPADAPVAAAQAPKKEKKICKSLDGDTGTRMSRRVCMTQEAWDQQGGGGRSADDLKAMGAH